MGGSPPDQRPDSLVRHLITIFRATPALHLPLDLLLRCGIMLFVLARGFCRAHESLG